MSAVNLKFDRFRAMALIFINFGTKGHLNDLQNP